MLVAYPVDAVLAAHDLELHQLFLLCLCAGHVKVIRNVNIVGTCLDGLVEPPVGAVHERAVAAQHLAEAVLLAPTRVAGILKERLLGSFDCFLRGQINLLVRSFQGCLMLQTEP